PPTRVVQENTQPEGVVDGDGVAAEPEEKGFPGTESHLQVGQGWTGDGFRVGPTLALPTWDLLEIGPPLIALPQPSLLEFRRGATFEGSDGPQYAVVWACVPQKRNDIDPHGARSCAAGLYSKPHGIPPWWPPLNSTPVGIPCPIRFAASLPRFSSLGLWRLGFRLGIDEGRKPELPTQVLAGNAALLVVASAGTIDDGEELGVKAQRDRLNVRIVNWKHDGDWRSLHGYNHRLRTVFPGICRQQVVRLR